MTLQPRQPVRRCLLRHGDYLGTGDPGADNQRPLQDDEKFLVQVQGAARDLRDQFADRKHGQDLLAEMLPQFLLARGRPRRLAGVREPGDHPLEMRQRLALDRRLAADELLEGSPARLAVLGGDGLLRVMQRGELPDGQSAFRRKLQIPQAWVGWQRTSSGRHGSPSFTPAGPLHRAGKTGI